MRYKNLIVDDPGTPATEKEIGVLEEALGCALPEDYVQFLKACNGGYLEYDTLVEFEDGTSEYLSFSGLYQASDSCEWECNPFELKQERKNADFPREKVLPIGRDGGSSRLFIDLRGGYKVVAFVQGLPEWTGPRTKDSLVVLADSFDEYLEILTLCDETIEHHIESFNVTEESVQATIEWLDSAGTAWREQYQLKWNERVPFQKI
ncbi:SMI1/KNR4 family protein [Marinobacter zhejiangensis]|uniref:SMI1/KNR4 family protein n=1 Tax=Marinobacter zhejiangensis TaxID=488535 RepID=UPI000B88A73F|nr:SMI1/KNR4 family protein [Marinobacter zhejiangensis]